MRCTKCNNDYQNTQNLSTSSICNSCYEQLPEEEKMQLAEERERFIEQNKANIVQYKRIGFGNRFLARFLDGVFLNIISFMLFAILGYGDTMFILMGGFGPNMNLTSEQFIREVMSLSIVSIIISLLYYSTEIFLSASLGKLIVGIKIRKPNGEAASKGALALRYLLYYSFSIFALIAIIPQSWVILIIGSIIGGIIGLGQFLIFSSKKMCLHDRIAKTAVYHKNDIAYLEEHS